MLACCLHNLSKDAIATSALVIFISPSKTVNSSFVDDASIAGPIKYLQKCIKDIQDQMEITLEKGRKSEDYAEPMTSHHTICEDYARRAEPTLPLPPFHDNILPQLAARPTAAAVEEGET